MKTPLFVYRLRKLTRRVNFAVFALPMGMVVVAGLGFALLKDERRDRPSGGDTVSQLTAVEAQTAGARLTGEKTNARMDAAVVEEMREKPQSDLSSLPPFEVPPPLLSIDGTGFRRGEYTIRFDRIAGPSAGAVCFDGEQRWSCGLQARAALHNLVAGRKLSCQPRRALADGGIGADCNLDAGNALAGGDIALLLVERGWARPVPEDAPEFAAAFEKARAAGAGLWRGGWRILTP